MGSFAVSSSIVRGTAIVVTVLTLALAPMPGLSASPANTTGVTTVRDGDLLTNGGFERPVIDEPWVAFFPEGPQIPGWQVTLGSVDLVSTDWPAGRGRQSLGLNGFGPGRIRQDVPTEPGSTYRVTFLLWGDPNGGPSLSKLRVRWDRQLLTVLTVDVSEQPEWRREDFCVTATSAQSRLSFRGLTETDAGPALDAVSIAPAGPACADLLPASRTRP